MKDNFASTVESVDYEQITTNTMYDNLISLSNYPRAIAIAPNFQWYRITEVKFIYKPLWNTYQGGPIVIGPSPNPTTVPQMIWIMNRNGTFGATTSRDLLDQGAKPMKFTKDMSIKYKPNTLTLSAYTGSDGSTLNNAAQLQWNEWLPTQPVATALSVPYYGHQFLFQQDYPTGPNAIADLTIQVRIEFKQPAAMGELPSLPVAKPVIKTS